MSDLARRDELPSAYLAKLAAQNLEPLWPNLRTLLPYGRPQRLAKPAHWRYSGLRPLLIEAGSLTPIDRSERRVLVLCNPGYPAMDLKVSAALYVGMQLLLPGEVAPNHRHTPSAVRVIVEGGGSTTVEGERLPMERGDLILTPSGLWHQHAHDGTEPVIWMDVLDLPLLHYLEASYAEESPLQPACHRPDASQTRYRRGGLLPVGVEPRVKGYPLLRYPWSSTRQALLDLALDREAPELLMLRYVSPLSGESCLPGMGCAAVMVQPGSAGGLPPRSASTVLHIVEGAARVTVGESEFLAAVGDVIAAPAFLPIRLENESQSERFFGIVMDDAPLQKALRFYTERPLQGAPTLGTS